MQQLLRILDSRLLSWYGNVKDLLELPSAAALLTVGSMLTVISLATDIGPVPLLFIGLGLSVFLLVVIRTTRSRRRDAFPPDAPPSAVALRYNNGTQAIHASVTEALAQAGHDVAIGQAEPQGVYSRDGETLAGRLEIEQAADEARSQQAG